MAKKTYLDYPAFADKHGIITGFRTAYTDFLLAVKNDLCLSAPISVLVYLQNHYRLSELRDPTVDELIMLDIICTNAETETEYLISDFKTNDKKIAETFYDFTEKYSLLYGGEKGPVRASRILTAAERYFSGCGFTGGRPVSERKTPKNPVYLLTDDSVISEARGNGIYAEKLEKGESFFDSVLTDCKHAELYVSDLTDSLRTLPTFGGGGLSVALCSENDAAFVGNIAASRGAFFKIIGRKNKKGKFRFTAGQTSLAIDADLMAGLSHRRINSVTDVVISESAECAGVSSPQSGVFVADPTKSPFAAGEKLIIAAAAHAVACGIRPEDALISCKIALPTEFGAENTVSLLLGIYRAEIELCVMSRGDSVRISDAVTSCSALAAVTAGSGAAKKAHGGLFIISPTQNGYGYEGIRRCLDYILKFRASGHTSAIYEISCPDEAINAFPFARDEIIHAGSGFAVAADCIPMPAEGVSVACIKDKIPSDLTE